MAAAVLLAVLQPPAHAWVAPAAMGRSVSLGSLTLTGVSPRIFTPNGDGTNDRVGFRLENPEMLPAEGEIFDISGAKVADLQGGADPTSLLFWDGKDSGGRGVPGGIYLYQIEFQGKRATGTVVVAR